MKRAVTIPTVSALRLYAVDGRKVGYLNFRNFVEPSFSALDSAFAQLHAAGANELVLDLRYNGGGLVAVAQHLASLIGGSRTLDPPSPSSRTMAATTTSIARCGSRPRPTRLAWPAWS